MDVERFKRTRPKTPCFWIGHLDSQSREPEVPDISAALAGQYQAVLPARTFTPLPELDPSRHPHKPLRKVKGQLSLRDLVTCQEATIQQEASVHSDSETLIGTPSLGSPTSGTFSWKSCKEFQEHNEKQGEGFMPIDEEVDGVGFKICLDLLTSELATGLFKKHPTESLDRASGLQILLMIEAYEAVQQHVKQELVESHVTGKKADQVKEVEKTLDNWLGALHKLYDRTQLTKSNDSLRSSKGSFSHSPTRPLGKLSYQQSIRSDLDKFHFDFEAKT